MTQLLLAIALLYSLPAAQPKANEGIVNFSFDKGNTWENNSKGLPPAIFLSDIATGDDLLGLTTKHNGVFIFHFPTHEWRSVKTIPLEKDEINALCFYQNKLFAGSKNNGVFVSSDKGDSWNVYNEGLKNLTIRKLRVMANKFYACTNGGLYRFDDVLKTWKLEYGHASLQVNGITELDDDLYLGTNQGAYKKKKNETAWTQLLPNSSLHNIGNDRKNIYALTYSELLISSDKGISWQSDQKGMPAGMYSFQVMEKENTVLAGQWDGVYTRTASQGWKLSNVGLPANFPVLELVAVGDMIVAGSSQWSGK